MDTMPDDQLDRIVALAGRLREADASTLLKEIPSARAGSKTLHIRKALVRKLNGSRPNRTRRLFTSLIEPFLTDDPALLLPSYPASMVFHRADAAGLWYVLARNAFPEIASLTAPVLDRLCEAVIVDEALASHAAVEARDRMRTATIDYLQKLLENRGALDRLLDVVNAVRMRELEKNGLPTDDVPRLGRRQIQDEATLLKAAPILLIELPKRLPEIAALAGTDPKGAAQRLLNGETALRGQLAPLGLPADCALALPLALLHGHRLYNVVSLYINRRGLRDIRLVGEGLVAHFSGVGHRIVRLLSLALRTIERGAPLEIEPAMRLLVDHETGRLGDVVTALAGCNAHRDPMLFNMIREGMGQFMADLKAGPRQEAAAIDVIDDRLSDALAYRGRDNPDLDGMIWTIGVIGRLHQLMRFLNLVPAETGRLKDEIGREILRAAGVVVRQGAPGDEPTAQFRHLERLATLGEGFGLSIMRALSPTSVRTQAAFRDRLNDPRPFSHNERRLVGDYMALVRSLDDKSARWQSSSLFELSQASLRRGV